jgi:hypothetical protein
MNELMETPAPAPVPVFAPPPETPRAPRRPVWLPVFCVLGFVLLAAGEAYLWRLDQVPNAQLTELAVLQAQVADLRTQAARAAPAPDSVTVQADLAQKLSALAAQVNAMQTQLAADHGALTQLQANSVDVSKLSAHLKNLATAQAAAASLDAGQPLGAVPGAPPALARYADAAPPTQAQLTLSFPDAARAAETASVAGVAQGNIWARVRAKLASLITVSEGAHVLVGAPAAGVIAQAQAELDAGDLAGAVAQLRTLSLTTQRAMGPWLNQAQALLDARAALRTLAAQS